MIDRRILRALVPTSHEVCLFVGCCIGVALVPVSEWVWVKLVLPRVF